MCGAARACTRFMPTRGRMSGKTCCAWRRVRMRGVGRARTRQPLRPPAPRSAAFGSPRTACIHRRPSEGGRPAGQIHLRKAFDDLIPILAASKLEPTRFIFHCFTGSPEDAQGAGLRRIDLFHRRAHLQENAPEVRAAAELTPLDRMLIETDAPFLSPEPFRGVRLRAAHCRGPPPAHGSDQGTVVGRFSRDHQWQHASVLSEVAAEPGHDRGA